MTRKLKMLVIALSVAAILIAAVATTVFAQARANSSVPTPTEADYQAWGCPAANGDYSAVTTLLGLTPAEIDAQLQQGKSLVDVAAGKGISEDKLVAAIIKPMEDSMQQQVIAGTLTQQQLSDRLKLADQHIRQLVNSKGTPGDSGSSTGGCGGSGMMGGAGTTGGSGMMGGSGPTY